MDLLQVILSLSLGLGLAAACGFRVFIPPLMMGVASRFDLYELEGSFVWVGETWAIGVFAMATLVEVGGYYIPWVDNLLDTIFSILPPSIALELNKFFIARFKAFLPKLEISFLDVLTTNNPGISFKSLNLKSLLLKSFVDRRDFLRF